MRTKTAYREIQPDNSAVNIPKELPVSVVLAPPEAPVVAVAVEPPVTAVEVDASLALQQQLQKLQESEQLQRQRAPQQLPQTREQKLHLWKQQGLTDAEANFLQQHPLMIDNPQAAAVAANEALAAGHARDSEQYWKATSMNFDNHIDRMRAQANPSEQPTPAFFQPPPPPKPPTRSHVVSAPVSRSLPDENRERDENPNKVTLSVDELAIAKASNISAADYARGKLELMRQKARGERQ
jgi:hypothetical protein